MEETSRVEGTVLTKRLFFAIFSAAFGSSFQHGYNTGVINNPKDSIENFTINVLEKRSKENVEEDSITLIWSVAVAIFCVGGMIGGMLIGIVANKFGRKLALLLNNTLVLISASLFLFSKTFSSFEMIIFGRFLIGINCGFNAGLSPMYLTEISPTNLRGAVGSVYQLILTISILISQILSLKSLMGTDKLWPELLAITAIPAVIQLLTLPFCPESPKYILSKSSNDEKAYKALVWLRGKDDVQEEINELKSDNEKMKLEPKVTIMDLVKKPSLRMPLTIAVVIMLSQQFSGINAAMFFSTEIFKSAKLDESSAQIATLFMGTVNVLMTVVSVILVEKFGRKTLLLVGFGGMFIDTILLTISLALVDKFKWLSYISVLLVNVFVIFFAVGPGSIPWFLVSELFNQSTRPTACSIAVTVNWTANFLVGISFLPLEKHMKGYVFVIFAICQLLTIVFVWFFVPETKQKPISEITALFERSQPQTTTAADSNTVNE